MVKKKAHKKNRMERKIMQDTLVNVNKAFGGHLSKPGNLDFEIDMALRKRKPVPRAAQLTRAMTASHSFSDGNKRTATYATMTEFNRAKLKTDPRKLIRTIVKLSKTRESDLKKIERKLRRCTKK